VTSYTPKRMRCQLPHRDKLAREGERSTLQISEGTAPMQLNSSSTSHGILHAAKVDRLPLLLGDPMPVPVALRLAHSRAGRWSGRYRCSRRGNGRRSTRSSPTCDLREPEGGRGI